MKRIKLRGLGLTGMALGLIIVAAPPAAGQAVPFSANDCNVFDAYRAALARPEVRTVSRAEIRRQLRHNPPVALLDGYWVSPVDVLHLLDVAADLRPGGSRTLVAYAFTTGWLMDRIPLPYVGDFRGDAGAGAQPPEIVLVPVKDPAEIAVEYLPPPGGPGEGECYYFCGDHTEWDFDGDGIVNSADPDDDDDGVPDNRDAYPYLPVESRCSNCGDRAFVGFTEKFSSQITNLVLAAHDRLRHRRPGDEAVFLAAVGEDQAAIQLLLPDERDQCRQEGPGCPEANAPGVRYVNKDPEACARIRFRCEEGQVGFSNACGCGCVARGGS